ncbi:MAG: Crp/Fnr family transcriptional regulator [Saprospiraceae bacterium]|nr:Crp/Fnr family transcriptional regulator [Saprospiraceae bacterium]
MEYAKEKEAFADYFGRFKPLLPEEKAAIMASALMKHFPKGHLLLEEGQIASYTFFVIKGCVRQFTLIDGEEKTTHFFTEEQWIISTSEPGEQVKSTYFLQCTEDCLLVLGNNEQSDELLTKFPRLERISRQVLEHEFLRQQSLQTSYITASPEQRYQQLQETHSNLLLRVPQYQIASYIGVKPETLSRIRKRLSEKS